MRLKLFLTIFLILNITVFVVMLTNFNFFIKQRRNFIDSNLKTYARTVTAFKISDELPVLIENENPVDGPRVLNLAIGIYDLSGQAVFENAEAKKLFAGTPDVTAVVNDRSQTWRTDDAGSYFVRILTEVYPKEAKIVRVALKTPKSTIQLNDVRDKVWGYVAGILLILTIISAFLTKFLLAPLSKLAKYLNELSNDIDQMQLVNFSMETNAKPGRFPDEFQSLVNNLNRFTDSLRTNFRLSKRSTLLLAHELKTPMTILRNTLEKMRQGEENPANVDDAILEVEKLDKIIAEFMDWTILDNNFSDQKNIHAIKLTKAIQDILDRHNSHGDAIIVSNLENETTIFANPIHLELLLNNIIGNGLKYSGRKPLAINLSAGILQVEDQGPGIPDEVMTQLGKPFNTLRRGDIPRGTGLGLAWIMTICKRYSWDIRFVGSTSGTTVVIDFNERENKP